MSLHETIERLEILVTEIRQASLTDDMTLLGNALALRDEARLISDGNSRFDVVVFGDLDDFKQLNDEHTHDAGDIAINKMGVTLHQIVVEDLLAKAFRKGGDEFVILLESTSIEKFQSAVSTFGSIPFSYNNKELSMAMSLGYARGDGTTSFESLLERAEVACQLAKTKGGGSCVEWAVDMNQDPLVRINGRCLGCGARISCTLPRQKAPSQLAVCPCCGKAL